jgi:predicted metal-binding membrane protein
VMMAAMMLPSAIPMIALYGATLRQRKAPQSRPTGLPVALFTAVYLAAWLAFGIPVYAASVLLGLAANNNPIVAGLWPYGVALVLAGAGLYQLSPLKRTCLRACQSPFGFLMGHWHSGYAGAIGLAWEHATFCLGCCAALMVVLVAAGAMSLPWVLLIAALVFVEKVLPRGEWTARAIGVGLCGLGLLVAVRPDLAMMLRGAGM